VDDLEDLSDSVHISCGKHRVEQEVQKELLAHPALSFSSLVVRRTQGGVCLEGVLEVDEGGPDVCRLAKAVSGVDEVLNHLVIQRRDLPAKG
jgi:osmotically-inducible protein OsmY